MEQDTSDVLTNKRETGLNSVQEESAASDRESRPGEFLTADDDAARRIAGPGLVFSEPAMGGSAAGKKALGKWNVRACKFADKAERGGARQHQIAAERMVRGILRNRAREA